jgi:hypothetical protein
MKAQTRVYVVRAWQPVERRALAIWPSLDRRALRRCKHDPRRIAALIGRCTSLTPDTVLGMLTMAGLSPEEREDWFG